MAQVGREALVMATTELMVLHVDKTDLKTTPFHPEPAARIAAIAAAQAGLPAPKYAGRRIAVPQG